MTSEQIEIVQSTWREIAPMRSDAATLFYGKLFDLDPSLRPLFRSDIDHQGRKFMSMIAMAVGALPQIETLMPAVQELGRRHAKYGVKAADYETVGAALLWTLEKGLGSAFTAEVRRAWAEAYATLASVMKAAGRIAA
jgi:hemoglobin-like flavoprotein